MDFGQVVGRVVCTIKDHKLDNIPLRIVQACNDDGSSAGPRLIAADAVGVGEGMFVWYETSREAPQAWDALPPVDAAIVGIVDKVNKP